MLIQEKIICSSLTDHLTIEVFIFCFNCTLPSSIKLQARHLDAFEQNLNSSIHTFNLIHCKPLSK